MERRSNNTPPARKRTGLLTVLVPSAASRAGIGTFSLDDPAEFFLVHESHTESDGEYSSNLFPISDVRKDLQVLHGPLQGEEL